jgi:GAF domain-containing protein
MEAQADPFIPTAPNEGERLQALRAYRLRDTQADADFDLLVELAAELCEMSFAFIALVDADRVRFKSSIGVRVIQANLQEDYCSWAILEPEGLNIPRLTLDPRAAQLPKTMGEPRHRMYSGANLVSSCGYRLDTLCVLDVLPRQLSARQIRLLRRLAGQVVAPMELRVRDAIHPAFKG